MPRPSDSNGGFTLVEALVAMAISGVLLSALAVFGVTQLHALSEHAAASRNTRDLRIALEQVTRTLRTAGLDPTGSSGAGLTRADRAELRFSVDADGDGSVSASDPLESYGVRRRSNALETLRPGRVGSWLPLADDLDTASTLFRYFRADGSEVLTLPTTDPGVLGSIRRVEVLLRSTRRHSESAAVWLRNVR